MAETALPTVQDIETCMESGWSDGLPVIPPYSSLVEPMIEAMGWAEMTDVVGCIEDQNIVVRAEHVGATAVMAGCKPEYGRVLRAIILAMLDPAFNVTGTHVTTGGPGTLVMVSGPVVEELGFEHEALAFGGAATRVNATVGRFANLLRLFCGSGGGTLKPMGTIGHPGRITYCIAEHPDRYWPPFHTQWGVPEGESAITVVAAEAPNSVNNHYGDTSTQILDTIADTFAHMGTTSFYWRISGYLIGLGRDHMSLVGKDFTRDEARHYIYEKGRRSTDELKRLGRIPRNVHEAQRVEFGELRSPLDSEKQLALFETGGAGGRFSAVIPRWAGNYNGVSRAIEKY
jgi:hypothetical protein